jgi:phage-related protein
MRRKPAGRSGTTAWFRKPIAWCGSSLNDLRATPEVTRRQAGRGLRKLQDGEESADWKPMPTVGPGSIELRFHSPTEHRVVVVTRFAEAIYVLHVFEKKSLKTPRRDVELARRRYNRLITERLA